MDQISEMKSNLLEQSNALREKLIKIEQEFNNAKESYFKVQGALEALQAVENVTSSGEE